MRPASRLLSAMFAVILLLGVLPGEAYAVRSGQISLPILSIETKVQGHGSTDFITKPVAPHVAESIAQWKKNYKMPPAPYSLVTEPVL